MLAACVILISVEFCDGDVMYGGLLFDDSFEDFGTKDMQFAIFEGVGEIAILFESKLFSEEFDELLEVHFASFKRVSKVASDFCGRLRFCVHLSEGHGGF